MQIQLFSHLVLEELNWKLELDRAFSKTISIVLQMTV